MDGSPEHILDDGLPLTLDDAIHTHLLRVGEIEDLPHRGTAQDDLGFVLLDHGVLQNPEEAAADVGAALGSVTHQAH